MRAPLVSLGSVPLFASVAMSTAIIAAACAVVACGDDGGTAITRDAPLLGPDAPPTTCLPLPATGQFVARAGNPRLLAGHRFADGKLDTAIADPDVHFDALTSRYEVYYGSPHGTAFGAADAVPTIRHVTSVDKLVWTYVDEPALVASPDTAAWDHLITEAPTVIFNPDAPAARRYLMLYAGAARAFPFPGYAMPDSAIGAAVSPDGVTFTRIPAAESPHGAAGLVLTGADAFPIATAAVVADPELALVDGTYHLYYSSFACGGPQCGTPSASGVGHATSTDGIHWTVAEAPVKSLLRTQSDPTSGGGQPAVVYDAAHCRWELWLSADRAGDHDNQPAVSSNSAGVYKAESTDGVGWSVDYTRNRDFAWAATAPRAGEHLGMRTGADVAENGTGRLLVYVGLDDQDVPPGFSLPDRTSAGFRSGVMTLDIATRDLP